MERLITQSSLALTIFRTKFYDDQKWPIHIPNLNQDSFIRLGYYGGHTDVYEPIGSNLSIYNINSFYPYIMATYDMPGGNPLCHGNLGNKKLEDLYGLGLY